MLKRLLHGDNIEETIQGILREIHIDGPVNSVLFEKLAHIKKHHGKVFAKYEKKLMNLMGLFYKTGSPQGILEEVYNIYADAIEQETGEKFTPVQASVFQEIRNKKYFSFSSPTSSGKSYLFRKLIQKTEGDIVIVVPSRALIAEYYYEVIQLVDSSVLVLQFIDNVNTEKTTRRVFIITPERGGELFKRVSEFNIELFLLDEAQISEEPVRGMKFDSFIRRIDNILPKAKKVFAHPYVDNPEAQLNKHAFVKNASYMNYTQHAVGKIFLSFGNEKFKYFSPHELGEEIVLQNDVVEDIIKNNGTLLVYISKQKIYEGGHIAGFSKYVELCPKIVDRKALSTIEKLREYIGAKKNDVDKSSLMLDMMERGVVIHHGSIPLKARLLIERFIRQGYARICFATSTLGQGINMPFDVVWIDNFHNMQILTLKNLIGRAGRSTSKTNSFDYGYAIVNKRNVATFAQRFMDSYHLTETSHLDDDENNVDEDLKDVVEAIRLDTFNDEMNLTRTQVERLSTGDIDDDLKYILDNLLTNEVPITGNAYNELEKTIRDGIKGSFKNIYIQHLRRKNLEPAEQSVLSTAIPIMLWRIQGKSFSEVISLRHSYLSQKKERRNLQRLYNKGEITSKTLTKRLGELTVGFTQIPFPLPKKGQRRVSLFSRDEKVTEISYDALVFDTYDYLDKVISLSISDPICAALEIYHNKTSDPRAAALQKYIRYGTTDDVEIWLTRYGYGFEEIEWIKKHVSRIDSRKIVFRDTVNELDEDRYEQIKRYL